jgi:hypothetical protein
MNRSAVAPTLPPRERTMPQALHPPRRSPLVAWMLGALLLLLPGAPLSGQLATGWTVGGATLSELNAGSGATVELKPPTGVVLGLHVDRWYGASERFAVRIQGAWQQPRFDWTQGERKIDAVSGDVSVLVRAIVPQQEEAFEVLPYLALGFGGMWYDLGRGSETGYPPAGSFHDGNSTIVPAAVFGGGADIGLPIRWFGNPLRVRLEVADHYALYSPFRNLGDNDRQGAIHNLRFTLGAYSVLDLVRIR